MINSLLSSLKAGANALSCFELGCLLRRSGELIFFLCLLFRLSTGMANFLVS